MTTILPFDSIGHAQALVQLHAGAVIAFPTDTVYGLGGAALNGQAIAHVYTIKERPMTMPLPVLLADVEQVALVAREVSPRTAAIAALGWPGALTLVLPARPDLPPELLLGGATIAVRVPNHAPLRALIHELGQPLAGTSANRHGLPAPSSALEVAAQLAGRIPLILDGGATGTDQPSTIIDLSSATPRVLRWGGFDVQLVAHLLPELRLGADEQANQA